jgi:hypothetical protein
MKSAKLALMLKTEGKKNKNKESYKSLKGLNRSTASSISYNVWVYVSNRCSSSTTLVSYFLTNKISIMIDDPKPGASTESETPPTPPPVGKPPRK